MKLQVFKILKIEQPWTYIKNCLENEDNLEFFKHKLIPAVIHCYYMSNHWFEERFYMPKPLKDNTNYIIIATNRKKGIFIQVRFESMISITLEHKYLQCYLR